VFGSIKVFHRLQLAIRCLHKVLLIRVHDILIEKILATHYMKLHFRSVQSASMVEVEVTVLYSD